MDYVRAKIVLMNEKKMKIRRSQNIYQDYLIKFQIFFS